MNRPSVVIEILHKAVLHNIATLTLFTTSQRPDILSFDVRDNLELLPKDSYLLGYKPVAIAGEYHIREGVTEENVDGLVSELIGEIEAQYLAQSLIVHIPERNMQHGCN